MITERHVTVEQKHRDPITLKNCRHMVFSSNEDWPVHIDKDDRRFFVLEISDKHKEDIDYFKKIHEWAKNGGYGALLDDLLHYDISNFNFRNVPQSESALQIKLDSACSTEVYIFEALKERRFGLRIDSDYMTDEKLLFWNNDPVDVKKNGIYEAYVHWCEDQKFTLRVIGSLGGVLKN